MGFREKKTLEARRRTRGEMYLLILGEPIIEPAAKEAAYWQLGAVRVVFASMPMWHSLEYYFYSSMQ